jgi:hypothetical protein
MPGRNPRKPAGIVPTGYYNIIIEKRLSRKKYRVTLDF